VIGDLPPTMSGGPGIGVKTAPQIIRNTATPKTMPIDRDGGIQAGRSAAEPDENDDKARISEDVVAIRHHVTARKCHSPTSPVPRSRRAPLHRVPQRAMEFNSSSAAWRIWRNSPAQKKHGPRSSRSGLKANGASRLAQGPGGARSPRPAARASCLLPSLKQPRRPKRAEAGDARSSRRPVRRRRHLPKARIAVASPEVRIVRATKAVLTLDRLWGMGEAIRRGRRGRHRTPRPRESIRFAGRAIAASISRVGVKEGLLRARSTPGRRRHRPVPRRGGDGPG